MDDNILDNNINSLLQLVPSMDFVDDSTSSVKHRGLHYQADNCPGVDA